MSHKESKKIRKEMRKILKGTKQGWEDYYKYLLSLSLRHRLKFALRVVMKK